MIHTSRQEFGRMLVLRNPKHIALQSGDWGHTEWSQDMPGWDMRGSVWYVLQAYKMMLRVYWWGERLHVQQILAAMGGWCTAPRWRWGCAANSAELSTWTVCPSTRTEQVLRIPHAVWQDDWRGKRQEQEEIPVSMTDVIRCKKKHYVEHCHMFTSSSHPLCI